LQLEQGQSAGSGTPHRIYRAGRAVAAAAGLAAFLVSIAGCGNTYRPVVAAINPVGPAGQPQKYAMAISSPSSTSNGLVTMVDFSGDTVVITATLGVNPYYFILSSGGTTGFTLNSDKTVNSFDVSTQLITSNVLETTLLPGSNPVSLFPGASSTYIPDPGLGQIDQLSGTPPALKQSLPVAANPIYIVGTGAATRIYAISQGTGGGPGQVAAIETGANTISTTLPVGRGPVYGVMTGDSRRAFIMNQTDGTVTAINSQTNALDSTAPTIPVGVAPLWADLVPTKNELVVANEGTGTSLGSVTIVSIPLCSVTSLPNQPNCDPNNPVDASTFGTVLANVPVGVNPIMITALSDGTRAYVANAGVAGLPCSPNGQPQAGFTTCTVSVVNLTSNTVTATIPINGHPAYIASTNASPTGKVYVVCKDSQVMTVIETDTDAVDTTIPLQGFGVSVRVTQP
jgi:DNA-binding beta-propeller fold protein YncE